MWGNYTHIHKKKETAILTGCLPHLISWRTISKKIRVVFSSNFTYAVFNVLPLKHLYITYIESVICKIKEKRGKRKSSPQSQKKPSWKTSLLHAKFLPEQFSFQNCSCQSWPHKQHVWSCEPTALLYLQQLCKSKFLLNATQLVSSLHSCLHW